MNKTFKLTYILLIIGMLLFSCKQTKYVPEGEFLLKKNVIKVDGDKLNEDDVSQIIRQKPNFKTLGLKIKLLAFNSVDSAAVAQKRYKKNVELRTINSNKLARQEQLNKKRIEKSRKKSRLLYTEKIVQLKDTVNPKKFFREWFKYKIGEKPIVFDSILYNKSLEQLNLYLKNRGYYYGSVEGSVQYLKNRKVKVNFLLHTGPQYIIDSVYIITENLSLKQDYYNFVNKEENAALIGLPFDKDYLNNYRDRLSKFMRDDAFFGFSSSHINYIADTSYSNMAVKLGIQFTDRLVRSPINPDSLISIKHKTTYIKDVFFHISDTTYYRGNFKQKVEGLGLTLLDQQFIRTIDTFSYAEIKLHKSEEIDKKRMATFLYNGKLSIDPAVIEVQNYLEKDNYYKEYYLERTYTRLLQLGLFQVIKPVLIEIPGTEFIDVHYYLVPSQIQSLGFEPRATNSNGFLGVATSINYTNKNLFGGAEKMTISISGGFESQPPIFDQTLDGEKIKKAGRSFNTFEIGPSIKFDLPGLFPTKVTTLSKRQRPRTVISTAYNYQVRTDFKRQIFQLNYLWRFYVAKTQIFQIGLPGASIVKFVRIENSDEFQSKLDVLNDLFLKNAYSNQFIWQDWKLTFEYNNKDKDFKKNDISFYMNSTFDPAGNTLSLFKGSQDTTATGQRKIFGVGYSQFARLDNEIIVSNPIGRKKSIHARLQFGGGIPYGNTKTSLPYDYSFFAGGSNDNRGWRARALGPGSYKYYLDTNRTATQIGDIRLGGSTEFRFSLGDMFKGALFVDAGNVWTFRQDDNRQGSRISSNWYREIALSAGLGFRVDLDFFIIRLDFGVPLTNPALPNGEKWIFKRDRPKFESEALAKLGPDYKSFVPKLFTPNIHFGIGYPF
jgi:outer membrane protein assembly factor BamA